MNRRFVAFLVMLAMVLQGPVLAYAGTVTARTVPATCAGQVLGQNAIDDSCCPQGIPPGLCCAGGLVLTALPSTPITLPLVSGRLMPPVSGSVLLATDRPTPLFRPPIA